MRKKLLFVCIIFLSHNVSVRADSTASLVLNWSAATFSGPIAPVPPAPPAGQYVEFANAGVSASQGSNPAAQNIAAGAWDPITDTVSAAAGSATTTLGSDLSVLSTQSSHSGVAGGSFQRWGSITTPAAVTISIPYAFNINQTLNATDGLLDSGSAFAEITLWQAATDTVLAQDAIFLNGLNVPGDSSGSGTLTFSDYVPPGTYEFVIDGGSSAAATFVPEPSTIALLGSGLLGIVGVSLRRLILRGLHVC